MAGWTDEGAKGRAKFTGKGKGLGLLRRFLPNIVFSAGEKATMKLSGDTQREGLRC